MKPINYILERLKKIRRMRRDYIDSDLSLLQGLRVYVDLGLSIVMHGCGITDYFQYRFYGRSFAEKKTFMVHRQRMWLVRNFNKRKDRDIFDCKVTFNRIFNPYLGRAWLDLDTCSYSDFESFAEKAGQFMVKPVRGSHGIGVNVINIEDHHDLTALFEELKSRAVVVEELIEQHAQLAEFNPGSVNTLRVVTLLNPENTVNLMTASLRLGNGPDRFADNFHHNGIAALVDIKIGRVITAGVDKNLNYYDQHPLGAKRIRGFRVPAWGRVVDLVNRSALVVPTVRYVGWDVAVDSRGQAVLIEGNAAADPDISQMPDQVGKWPLYLKVLQSRHV